MTGIIILSLKVACLATLLATLPAMALAWILARKEFPGKTFAQAVIMLPMVLPPVASGLFLMHVFYHWQDSGFAILLNWKGAVVAAMFVAFPLYVRALEQAFAEVPRRLESVAAVYGKRPLQVFTSVTLPLARRGLISGALLMFARSLGEFGATILVAGNIPGETETLSIAIYSRILSGNEQEAWWLVAAAVAISFAAVFCSEWLLRKKP